MSRTTLYGLIATMCGAALALDATLGVPSQYLMYHKLFPNDDDWQIARNGSYILLSLGAAGFGYLALNANGKKD